MTVLPSIMPATTGEVRLVCALLEDAWGIITGSSGQVAPNILRETREWIERGNVGLFSFDFVCDMLGLDPSHVRLALLRRSRRAT